jgi:glutaryl-CoA dehydrogenase
VRVPAGNRLPGANTFKNYAGVLVGTRSACAWMALGHAVAGFDAALSYAKRRQQFGKSLTSFQIIQQRLVGMLADVTAMQLYCIQTARLAEAGLLAPPSPGSPSCTTPAEHGKCSPTPATCSAEMGFCSISMSSAT